MHALRVLADDLTGACDVGAEFLPWPGGVAVNVHSGDPRAAARPAALQPDLLWVHNTQSRTLPPADAAARVARTLDDLGPGWGGIVLKKIDTALRGQLGAEIDAAMDALGAPEAFVLPAIPEVGRTTEGGRQLIDGVPVDRTAFASDPQNPIRDASVPAAIALTGRRRAAVVGLEAIRSSRGLEASLEAGRRAGAAIFVCDAETDDDLERAVRALLRRPCPLLLVGSIGLARSLRRVLGPEHPGRPRPAATPPTPETGVLVVVGSAHPAARAQVARAAERAAIEVVAVEPDAAEQAGVAASALVARGRATALVAPEGPAAGGSSAVLSALRRAALTALARTRPAGLALIGGETAFEVLDGLGSPPLLLECRLAPLVVRSRLVTGPYGGLPLVSKGGSSGAADLLTAIVRQLGRGGH